MMLRALTLLLLLAACNGDRGDKQEGCGDGRSPTRTMPPGPVRPKKDGPYRVLVDQIVISFRGAARPLPAAGLETEAEAKDLAQRLFRRLKGGVSFDLLRKEYTDTDKATPGLFVACNKGVPNRARPDGLGEVPYKNLATGWRRVVFKLKPGELGLVEYHKQACPEGFYIVKRLQ